MAPSFEITPITAIHAEKMISALESIQREESLLSLFLVGFRAFLGISTKVELEILDPKHKVNEKYPLQFTIKMKLFSNNEYYQYQLPVKAYQKNESVFVLTFPDKDEIKEVEYFLNANDERSANMKAHEEIEKAFIDQFGIKEDIDLKVAPLSGGWKAME